MNTVEIVQLKAAVNAGRVIMYQSHSLTSGGSLKRVHGFHKDEKTGDEYAVIDHNRPEQGAHLGNNGPGAFMELTRLFPNAS